MNSILRVLRVPSVTGMMGGLIGSSRTLMTRPQLPHTQGITPTPVFGCGVLLEASRRLLLQPQTILGGVSGRTNIRCHFPRPNERKRILRHGWEARISTRSGRKVLRRRIMKGRHILSH